jgi:hypothetical protein
VSAFPEERTYDDAVEIDDGLWVGSHPEPEDPFELGADVVITLTLEPAATSAPPGKLLIHWPIRDGPPGRASRSGPPDLRLPGRTGDRVHPLSRRDEQLVSRGWASSRSQSCRSTWSRSTASEASTGPDVQNWEAKLQDPPAGSINRWGPRRRQDHDRLPRFFEDVPEKAPEDEEGRRHR